MSAAVGAKKPLPPNAYGGLASRMQSPPVGGWLPWVLGIATASVVLALILVGRGSSGGSEYCTNCVSNAPGGPNTQTYTVPSIIGLDRDSAKRVVNAAGMQFGDISCNFSFIIRSQTPTAGTSTSRNQVTGSCGN